MFFFCQKSPRALGGGGPTNNMLEVWQNSAPFGDRPIGAAVEALLTIVVNRRSSVSPIIVFFIAPAVIVDSVIVDSVNNMIKRR